MDIMKKALVVLSALLMFTSCAENDAQNTSAENTTQESLTEQITQETQSLNDSTYDETTMQEEYDFVDYIQPTQPLDITGVVDENGLITDKGIENIVAILEIQQNKLTYDVGLFDFDRDGIPEVYIVQNNGGQGCMPVCVATLDGTYIGGFNGYCRDGWTRLSYGKDCVYVHNYYEHSEHLSYEEIETLTYENGILSFDNYAEQSGYVSDAFPMKEFSYCIDGEQTDEKGYFDYYNSRLYEDNDISSREANEVSICSFADDFYNELNAQVENVAKIYNSYVSGRKEADKLFGSEKYVYAFSDYDSDGRYEAFVRDDNFSEYWYFWDSNTLEKTEIKSLKCTDFTKRIGMLFAQQSGDNSNCVILDVKDGKPFEHELSCVGMLIRNGEGFNRADVENYVFTLRKSAFDTDTIDPGQTFKPYYFEYGGDIPELVGTAVTKDDFSDREDVKAVFDEIEADGATVTGAYLRGERYLNINYTCPIMSDDENGVSHKVGEENHYKTYMIQNVVTLFDEGYGVYADSILND